MGHQWAFQMSPTRRLSALSLAHQFGLFALTLFDLSPAISVANLHKSFLALYSNPPKNPRKPRE